MMLLIGLLWCLFIGVFSDDHMLWLGLGVGLSYLTVERPWRTGGLVRRETSRAEGSVVFETTESVMIPKGTEVVTAGVVGVPLFTVDKTERTGSFGYLFHMLFG